MSVTSHSILFVWNKASWLSPIKFIFLSFPIVIGGMTEGWFDRRCSIEKIGEGGIQIFKREYAYELRAEVFEMRIVFEVPRQMFAEFEETAFAVVENLEAGVFADCCDPFFG